MADNKRKFAKIYEILPSDFETLLTREEVKSLGIREEFPEARFITKLENYKNVYASNVPNRMGGYTAVCHYVEVFRDEN